MSDSDYQPSAKDGLNLGLLTISSHTLLQLATVPVLTVLVAGKVLAPSLLAIAKTSEEVFRGELLPILPSPDKNG